MPESEPMNEKALGSRIGRFVPGERGGPNVTARGRGKRRYLKPARLNIHAPDADHDGLAQEGTTAEHAAVPADFADSLGKDLGVGRRIEEGPEHVWQMYVNPLDDLAKYHGKTNKDFQKIQAREPEFRKQVAKALSDAPEGIDPRPEVRRAYKAMMDEMNEQFRILTEELGYKVEFVDEDPYPNVEALVHDMKVNKRLKVLSTDSTGSHSLLTNHENDIFRAVHDAFGHAATGRDFSRHGEEAAYQAHITMFSPLAKKAAAAELRAQTAYLIEFGTFMEEQKATIMPDHLIKWVRTIFNTKKLATLTTGRARTPDDDNLYKIGKTHHASNGRHKGTGKSPQRKDAEQGFLDEKGVLSTIGRMMTGRSDRHIGDGGHGTGRAEDLLRGRNPADVVDRNNNGRIFDNTPAEMAAVANAEHVVLGSRNRRNMAHLPSTSALTHEVQGAEAHVPLADFVKRHDEIVKRVTAKHGQIRTVDDAHKALSKAFPHLMDRANFGSTDDLHPMERGFVHGLLDMADAHPDVAKTMTRIGFIPPGDDIDGRCGMVMSTSATGEFRLGTEIVMAHDPTSVINALMLEPSYRDREMRNGVTTNQPYLVQMATQVAMARRRKDTEAEQHYKNLMFESNSMSIAQHEFAHAIHFHAINKENGLDFSKPNQRKALMEYSKQMNSDSIPRMFKAMSDGNDVVAGEAFMEFIDALQNHSSMMEAQQNAMVWDHLTSPEVQRLEAEMQKVSQYARTNEYEAVAEAIAAEASGIIRVDTPEMKKLRQWLNLNIKSGQANTMNPYANVDRKNMTIHYCSGYPQMPKPEKKRTNKERVEKKAASGTSLRDALYLQSCAPKSIDIKAFALGALVDSTGIAAEFKGGLVSSHDGGVQFVESAVSYAVPGDLSRVRSPVRSTAYRAATPGGGGGGTRRPRLGRAIGRVADEAMRCPTGYQHGGRFSNRFLSNCGQQLFDVPGVNINQPNAPGPAIGAINITRTIRNIGGDSRDLTARIRAGEYNAGGAISRMANVPHVGAPNKAKSDEAILSGLAAAGSAKSDFVRLVRRDGVALDAKVGIEKLAAQRNNVDMQGGTVISRAATPASIGKHEVNVLASGAQSVRIVVPGGHEIRIDRGPNFSDQYASEMRRQWGVIARTANTNDGALGLQRLAEKSRGKIIYSEKFNNIETPNQLVKIERNNESRTMPRWMFLSYFSESAPGRTGKEQPWKEVGTIVGDANTDGVVRSFGSAVEARKAIERNAPLSEVSARFLGDAIKASNAFKRMDLGGGRSLLIRKNGERYLAVEHDAKTAISERVAADVSKAVGVATPDVRLAGTEARRTLLGSTPENVLKGGKISHDGSLRDVPVSDLARIALADYLTGRTGRNAGSISLVDAGDRLSPVIGLTGTVSKIDLSRKPEVALAAGNGGGWLRPYVTDPTPTRQVRQSLIEMYDSLVKQATEFDWEAYITRLSLDGDLSEADKIHLASVQRLYASRLEQLKSSRKSVLRVIGAGGAA